MKKEIILTGIVQKSPGASSSGRARRTVIRFDNAAEGDFNVMAAGFKDDGGTEESYDPVRNEYEISFEWGVVKISFDKKANTILCGVWTH